ncbi:MAG: hypothetical protein ACOVOQ_01295 [Flavobacterium sp.]
MNALTIQNTGNEMLIRFDRSTFDETYLMALIKRLEIEATAQAAQVSPNIGQIANEIDNSWWAKNGDDFLKDVKR